MHRRSAVKRTADRSGGVGRTGFIAGLSTGAAHPKTGITVFSPAEAEVRGFGLLPDEMGFATLTLRSTHPTGFTGSLPPCGGGLGWWAERLPWITLRQLRSIQATPAKLINLSEVLA